MRSSRINIGTEHCIRRSHAALLFQIVLTFCLLYTSSAQPCWAQNRFSVLHRFGSSEDGRTSWSSLTLSGSTLYGTTYEGGVHRQSESRRMAAGIEFSTALRVEAMELNLPAVSPCPVQHSTGRPRKAAAKTILGRFSKSTRTAVDTSSCTGLQADGARSSLSGGQTKEKAPTDLSPFRA